MLGIKREAELFSKSAQYLLQYSSIPNPARIRRVIIADSGIEVDDVLQGMKALKFSSWNHAHTRRGYLELRKSTHQLRLDLNIYEITA
jgi:hypothetical protein